MATEISMPKLGLTMDSGSVQQWNKNVGDKVSKGELLYVVATDKLTVDVESPVDGVLLAVMVEEGSDVRGGQLLPNSAQAGAAGAAWPAAAEAPSAPASPAAPAPTQAAPAAQAAQAAPAAPGAKVPSSPKAKKLARDKGIDINTLTGTGPNGWVVARDVEKAGSAKTSPMAAKLAGEAGLDPAGLGKDGRVMKGDVAGALAAAGQPGRERRVPVTQMRRVIGQRMLGSTSGIPAVNYFLDVDMSALNKMRASFNARLAKTGVKLSINDIMMKLCAKLLLEHPLLNGSVDQDAFIMHDYVNIGFAVALPGGLLVPNIKGVETKSLTAIARERADLVENTRKGSLSPDQMAGATFTISNLGMMGVDSFTPIINPPEVAILGLGTTSDKAVVVDGEVAVRPVATLCLTADHRLVDGADAAAFLAKLKELVENPDLFLL